MKNLILFNLAIVITFSFCVDHHENEMNMDKNVSIVGKPKVFIQILNDTLTRKPIIDGILFCNHSNDTICLISSTSPELRYSDINYFMRDGNWNLGIPDYSPLNKDTIKVFPLEVRFLKLDIPHIGNKLIDSIDPISYKFYKNHVTETTVVICKDAFAFKGNKYFQYKTDRIGW